MLDIGCGNKKHEDYLGIDIKKDSQADILGSVEYLPFKDNVISKILLSHVIEHVNDIISIKEIHRILKLNGSLHVITPNSLDLKKILMSIYKDYIPSSDHVHTYGYPELKILLELEFKIINTDYTCPRLMCVPKRFSRWLEIECKKEISLLS